ncbi:MAG TPA: extracellular matrix/biofilm biosynthesis regulator RemA family protein [Oscillospiraceae bacterium]|nr:extracellular matrix/biofilm biosynthesis regulator RemA family protein [Oscillospiraceae bacterium]
MYLHLGNEVVVSKKEIVGIFDIENTSVGRITKDFLANASKNAQVISVSEEMPKSFIICKDTKNKVTMLYISQISPATLKKRAQQKY